MDLVFGWLAPLALCAPLAANGGFTPGELVLYTPALNGISSVDGGLVRIDPLTGTVTHLLDLTGSVQSSSGSMAYDPYRDRVIFVGSFPTVNDPKKMWLIDAFGGTTDLGTVASTYHAFAPASAGRIYFRTNVSATPLRYLDATNVEHVLLDAGGTQPFVPVSSDLRAMLYDPGTNSLFIALPSMSAWNCGVATSDVTIQRVPLSADGSRVAGTADCVQVAVEPGGHNVPVGLSRGPNGQLLLTVDTNSNQEQPRMRLIDPVSLSVSSWASNGYPGAAATNAGTWSSILGRAVLLDTWTDVLRSYASGGSGQGTLITTSSPVSWPGSSGEIATLIEIPLDGCNALVGLYCTAKTTSGGCTPAISTAGSPSASAGSGFVVGVDDVEPGNVGILFYGHAGPAAAAFQGGFLCVQPPTWRTAPQSSGGAAACSGSYALDFNAYAASSNDPSLVPGAVIHGQFWFRDPPEPISGTGLSGGVTFTLCP